MAFRLIDPVLMNNDTRIQDAATAGSGVHREGILLQDMIFSILVFTFLNPIAKACKNRETVIIPQVLWEEKRNSFVHSVIEAILQEEVFSIILNQLMKVSSIHALFVVINLQDKFI